MQLALLVLNLMILASCTPSKTTDAAATSGNINSSAPYLWSAAAFPRDLKISDQFSTDEVSNITSMSSAWETAVEDKKNFFNHGATRVAEISSPTLDLNSLGEDGVEGIYKIVNWPTSLPGSALAVTQLFGRRFNIGTSSEFVRIEHADILINEHLYNFRTSNTHVNGSYDLRTVLLHEMGHYLGLNHRFGDTVMVPSIGEFSNNRTPTNTDRSDIASKYSITLGSGSSSAVVANTVSTKYVPQNNDSGKKIKILIELMSDGECVHKEDGAVIQRHRAYLK
jgi:hypothetical protein